MSEADKEGAGATGLDPAEARRRCGFIAVIGAPNAGKSTLVNALVGAKVAIVSHKVQTTRSPVRGIATEGGSQLVFIDTPGLFEAKRRIERSMACKSQICSSCSSARRSGVEL
jgi:GTP-binding protein Era